MNYKKSFSMDINLQNKVISVAYGDANILDKIAVFLIAKRNSEVKRLLDEYRETAQAVHAIELDECPEELLTKVHDHIRLKYDKRRSFFFDLYSVIFAKPIASTAAITILMAAILSAILFQKVETQQTYTQQEIDLANRQVKESFAILSNIFTKAQTTIENDILITRVGKPIKEGINIVNNLFNEGEKNENNK